MLELGRRLVRGAVVQVDAAVPVAEVGGQVVLPQCSARLSARSRWWCAAPTCPLWLGHGRAEQLVPAVDPGEHGVAAHAAATA
ncbi:hypothetical protein MUY14_04065 [Amycolatopsis sp. FBCC-B4732]|uniref:hypothetical protein n=1 Tax=Amycolatopsis sp. FBCC-B4732 TaxID=3079339 RepID=UPI001FF365D4|nr:hypothetical protein [Amycolatopsis sp. FBCC-B4732]UOX89823.1 hypothetical protein MUY14_04065 [Amycolatopsis sp. FBCC-B4732]